MNEFSLIEDNMTPEFINSVKEDVARAAQQVAISRNEYQKIYRQQNKEKSKAVQKRYRQRNKEKLQAYAKAYRLKNKHKIKSYQAAYRKAHKYPAQRHAIEK